MAEVQVPAAHELQDNSSQTHLKQKHFFQGMEKFSTDFRLSDPKFTAADHEMQDTFSQTPFHSALLSSFSPTKPEFRRTKKVCFADGHFCDTGKVLVSFYLQGVQKV